MPDIFEQSTRCSFASSGDPDHTDRASPSILESAATGVLVSSGQPVMMVAIQYKRWLAQKCDVELV